MQKKLLLAISDDRAASYNLRFLKEVFNDFCDLKLTLFYVTPKKATWDIDKDQFVPRGQGFDEFQKHRKTQGKRALDDAAKWVQDVMGCSGDNVRIKAIQSQRGTVLEMVDEARKGMYDALLLGRKGFSWFEHFFENSVSHELLWSDIDFPVWICKRPPENPRQDVLLCMDGSKASLRMIDHAAYMLANEPSHTFTLFHVAQKGYSSGRSGRIFDEGLAILDEHNVDEERIELKMATSKNVVKTIIKEALEGNYCAVGVGKHGENEGSNMRGLFPSSVAINLMRQLEHTALWVSR